MSVYIRCHTFPIICWSTFPTIVALLTQMGCVMMQHEQWAANEPAERSDAYSGQRSDPSRFSHHHVGHFPPQVQHCPNFSTMLDISHRRSNTVTLILPFWTFPTTGPTPSRFSHHVRHFQPQVQNCPTFSTMLDISHHRGGSRPALPIVFPTERWQELLNQPCSL